jgi:hypothetical protein
LNLLKCQCHQVTPSLRADLKLLNRRTVRKVPSTPTRIFHLLGPDSPLRNRTVHPPPRVVVSMRTSQGTSSSKRDSGSRPPIRLSTEETTRGSMYSASFSFSSDPPFRVPCPLARNSPGSVQPLMLTLASQAGCPEEGCGGSSCLVG